MDNLQQIISIISLLNDDRQSDILPWQLQDINKAQLLPDNSNIAPTETELLKYARGLSLVCIEGDVNNTEFLCFLPVSKRKWKVFALDKFNRVLAQLNDYDGAIFDNTAKRCKSDAFLLKMS